ncbi:thiolase family protein [Inquilinus limosus]|uniref:acetyl-CoA C-acyltransferase n=1 Tax=Inquilinus limosus MP06 TaxID=1398085 RepID=A0A0A0DB76_9PROT|nr:thiolase family protein [Inquilinus limosus]KGM35946.1 acetyl-CoA acetyltransferase [Inquilinus limosus MP06]
MDKSVVIAGFKRSPHHFANKGELRRVRPDDLVADVIKALVAETRVDPEAIEDLILGCAFPEGEQGFNMARMVVFLAGLPQSVGGVTVNRYCGSSMQAIHQAAGAIQLGAGEAFLCAGVESMTRVPMMGFNPAPNPKLAAEMPQAYFNMGVTAENLAVKYQITRESQQDFAIRSQQRAAKAWAENRFAAEIVPIATKDGTVERDGTIRPDTSQEGLSGLKPAFDQNGTVTAGTSSPLTDGASATLVTSEAFAKAAGLPILARIRSIAVSGCAPEIMGIGPVGATRKALQRAGLSLKDIDVVELNEAFAAQALAVGRDLELDWDKTNIDGGAIALGHPLGASGARITGKAASILKREGKALALATMCIGGGQGIATVLEAV